MNEMDTAVRLDGEDNPEKMHHLCKYMDMGDIG